jgi:hypothetical protein
MKKLFPLLLVAAVIFMQSALSQTANTDPVGVVTVVITTGLNALGLSLLNADIFRSSAASTAGSIVSIAGETNIGSKLSATEPYYLEVYSGALKGDRFDIDVATTISAANGTLALNASSASNTVAVASIGNSLDGASVALRKHITLEQVQSQCFPVLVGNNNPAFADRISFFDNSGDGFVTYYLRGDGTTWRKSGTTPTANKTPIPPGTGIFFDKIGSSTTLTSQGSVRVNDFAMKFLVGNQLLAPPCPIDLSPAQLGGATANLWVGNNNPANADKISVYNSGLGGFLSYYLRGDGSTWRREGTTTVVTTTGIIPTFQAYFVTRKTADSNYILANLIQ